MRSIIFSITLSLLFLVKLNGQTPGLFKYQAVARNAQGELYQNQAINLKVAIIRTLDNSDRTVFEEEHNIMTSPQGIFSLNVGGGFAPYGSIDEIDWSNGQYHLNVQMLMEGDRDYTDMGNSPILAVPIALHAKTAENVDDADADPTNELQNLAIADNKLLISGGNHVDISRWTSPWTTTDIGLSYKAGKVDVNLINTIGIEAILGNNQAVFNGSMLEFKPDNLANSSKFNRHSLKIENGTKLADLTGTRLLFSNVNSSELNENALKLNGSNLGKYAQLNTTELTFTETIASRRKADFGLNGMTYENRDRKMTINEDGTNYYGKIGRDNAQLIPGYLRFTDNDETNNSTFSRHGAVVNASNGGSSLTGTELSFRKASESGKSAKMSLNSLNLKNNLLETDLRGGFMQIKNTKTSSFTNIDSEVFQMFSSNRQRLKFSSVSEGRIEVFNGSGKRAVHIDTKNGSGQVTLQADNGRTAAWLTTSNNNSGNGYLGLYHYKGGLRASLFTDSWSQGGNLFLYGSNNKRVVMLGTNPTSTGTGELKILDDWDRVQVTLAVDQYGRGYIATDIKNFQMDHPTKPNKEIWYASIEGPEAAAYERGTGQLKNGEAFIPYSDHFELVGNHKTATVILTPLSADTRGLAVIEKTAKGFRVKELMGGTGNFQFDWEVKAVRKGYENFEVIRDKVKTRPKGDEK